MSVSGFISSVLEKIRAHRHHFDEINIIYFKRYYKNAIENF